VTRKKILFVLFARLGDVCCGIPTYLELKNRNPDADVWWLTLRKYADLVPGKAVFLAGDEGEFGRSPDLVEAFDEVYVVQPMWRHEEWKSSRRHVIDLIADWCGITLTDRAIRIRSSPESTGRIDALPLPERFVLIGSSPSKSSRNLFPQWHEQIVAWCNQRRVLCGTVGGDDGVSLWGTLGFHGRLSPVDTAELINRCAVYVGPDTGTSWLACAAPRAKKICVLDRERLQDGVVGFEGYQGDQNVRDVFFQDGVESVLKLLDGYLR
jgi:hypothetical protein